MEGHPLHAHLCTNTPTPRTLHLSGPTHADTTLIPRLDLPEPQRKHLLTCVAPSLTHMCVPTHPSAPSCTLPAVARIHVRVCGSQTHFCCLLQCFPLAFVNTETFLLLVLHPSDFAFCEHITGGQPHTRANPRCSPAPLSPPCIQRGGLRSSHWNQGC